MSDGGRDGEGDDRRAARVVHPLHDWPQTPPPGYLGQLDPAYQEELARRAAGLDPDQYGWYHTTELSDGTVLPGHWDLRGHENDYLGGTDFRGRRVLELGPASGHLTFFMERQGADVTAFEAGFDCPFEYVPPVDGTDMATYNREFMAGVGRLNNAWWRLHQDRGSRARIAYGDIYNLPADIGDFEVSVFCSILLHLRDPFRALQQAAAHTSSTMVVTDVVHPGLEDPDDPVLRWGMDAFEHGPSQRWWSLSPGAVTRMLWRLGFGRVRLTTHRQDYHGARQDGEARPYDLFTVVATREAHRPTLPRRPPSLTRRVRARLGGRRR